MYLKKQSIKDPRRVFFEVGPHHCEKKGKMQYLSQKLSWETLFVGPHLTVHSLVLGAAEMEKIIVEKKKQTTEKWRMVFDGTVPTVYSNIPGSILVLGGHILKN